MANIETPALAVPHEELGNLLLWDYAVWLRANEVAAKNLESMRAVAFEPRDRIQQAIGRYVSELVENGPLAQLPEFPEELKEDAVRWLAYQGALNTLASKKETYYYNYINNDQIRLYGERVAIRVVNPRGTIHRLKAYAGDLSTTGKTVDYVEGTVEQVSLDENWGGSIRIKKGFKHFEATPLIDKANGYTATVDLGVL